MKKSKKMLFVFIVNLILFIIFVLFYNIRKYKYLNIVSNLNFFLIIAFWFLPSIIYVLFLKLTKGNEIHILKKRTILILIIIYIAALDLWLPDAFESRTTNVDNYLELDDTYKITGFLTLFPSKELVSNSKVIKYNYVYKTFDGNNTNSDIDLYLEIKLPHDQYLLEKERIESIDFNDLDFKDFKIVHDGYFENSSLELLNDYSRQVYMSAEEYHHYYYRFIAFFDDDNRIIYNYTDGYILPYFIESNRDDLNFS